MQILKESIAITYWKNLSSGEKIFFIITFINIGVYLAWDVAKWKSFMLKYFVINEGNNNFIIHNIISIVNYRRKISNYNIIMNFGYIYLFYYCNII